MRIIPTLNKRSVRRQYGLTLGEALLVLGVMSGVLVGAYASYKYARSDVGANALAQGAVQLAAQAQSVFGVNGGFASVTSANINSAGLVPAGWRWDGSNILDSAGNTVTLTAAAGSFSIVLQNMSASECTKAATQIEGASYSMRIGTAATAAAGVISGGNVYKSTAGVISAANLVAGCGEATRRVAIEVR